MILPRSTKLNTAALLRFVACALVVMLGGTRVLDGSLYRYANLFLERAEEARDARLLAEQEQMLVAYLPILVPDLGEYGDSTDLLHSSLGDELRQALGMKSEHNSGGKDSRLPTTEMPLQPTMPLPIHVSTQATWLGAPGHSTHLRYADVLTPPPKAVPATTISLF
jgi:hypothetical protein